MPNTGPTDEKLDDARVKALQTQDTTTNAAVATLDAKVAAIAAWGTALATKLNADIGVTDTNYDVTPLT